MSGEDSDVSEPPEVQVLVPRGVPLPREVRWVGTRLPIRRRVVGPRWTGQTPRLTRGTCPDRVPSRVTSRHLDQETPTRDMALPVVLYSEVLLGVFNRTQLPLILRRLRPFRERRDRETTDSVLPLISSLCVVGLLSSVGSRDTYFEGGIKGGL